MNGKDILPLLKSLFGALRLGERTLCARWFVACPRSVFGLALVTGALLLACAGSPTVTIVPTVTIAATEPILLPSPTPSYTSAPEDPATVTLAPVEASPTAGVTSTPETTNTPRPPTAAPTLALPSSTARCAETQGRIQTGVFFSAVIGREQPYRVYTPPCYDYGNEAYSVLYMLHGYPFDDSHWDDIGIDEAADAGIAAGTLPPFIIAMPAADNEGTFTTTSGGPGSYEEVVLDEFIPFIEANYRTVEGAYGRAIGGMSRGGVWSLEIAFRNPDRFAAVGGHSVALNVNRAPPAYDPLYLASEPAIHSLRIYLDVGQGDWVLPGMDELHARLMAADVAHDFHVFEGYHSDSYWSAHVAEYLAFYAADW